MLETLVITLREGLEAALIVSILLTFLKEQGRSDLKRPVVLGLFFALVASLAGVFVVPRALRQLDWNQEAYEGTLYLVGALLVGTFLVWLYRHRGWAASVRRQAEKRIHSRWAALAFFLLTFLLVFREGAETLLFVATISFSTRWILQFIGFLIGLGLAVLFGVGLYRGSRWFPVQRIFRLSTMVLAVLIVQFVVAGLHEWIEAGILPGGPREMALIGPLVNNQLLVFSLVLGLMAIFVLSQRPASTPPPTATEPGVKRRLWRAQHIQAWRWRWGFLSLIVVCSVVLTGFYVYNRAPGMAPARLLPVQNGIIEISVREIPQRSLTYFEVNLNGTSIRLLATRLDEHTVRVALDACTLCGPRGYYQKGGSVYCRHCAAPIVLETLGVPGGCNPVPVKFEWRGDNLRIRAKDVLQAFQQVQVD